MEALGRRVTDWLRQQQCPLGQMATESNGTEAFRWLAFEESFTDTRLWYNVYRPDSKEDYGPGHLYCGIVLELGTGDNDLMKGFKALDSRGNLRMLRVGSKTNHQIRHKSYFKSYPYPSEDLDSGLPEQVGALLVDAYDHYHPDLMALLTSQSPAPRTSSNGSSLKWTAIQHPLNQILYGPPGTGKTFATRALAVAICDNRPFEEVRAQPRQEINARYRDLEQQGRIVFTTFHQSLGYEDFIEGIKPSTTTAGEEEEAAPIDENVALVATSNSLQYEVVPGILKKLAKKAEGRVVQPGKFSYDELWTQFVHQLFEQAKTQEVVFKSTESELKLEPKFSREDSLKVRFKVSNNPDASEGTKMFPVTKGLIKRLFDAGIDASEGADYQWVNTRDVVGQGRATTGLSVYKSFYRYAEEKGVFASPATAGPQPHVLIIDEINRGNVSAVFGELITLIEEGKRSGQAEEITVRLPYSQEDFRLPSNIYFVGTMNTADRSVEALDTALRRRFVFQEMMPEPGLLEDRVTSLNLPAILGTVNQRLTYLKDKNHTLGHAFFFGCNSAVSVIRVLAEKVMPLLEEFFYGETVKVGLVLSPRFLAAADAQANANALFPGQGRDSLLQSLNLSVDELMPRRSLTGPELLSLAGKDEATAMEYLTSILQ